MADPAHVENARRHALALLDARAAGATICPSEVARALAGSGGDWRAEMPIVHAAIDTLVAERMVQLSWKGVPLTQRNGPYRIARRALTDRSRLRQPGREGNYR